MPSTQCKKRVSRSEQTTDSHNQENTKKKRRLVDNTSNQRLLLNKPKQNNDKQLNSSNHDPVQVLIESLENNDFIQLDKVLFCRNEKSIEKIARSIPTSSLLSLVDYLNKCLNQTAEKGLLASKWLKLILTIHSSYLMTHSHITESLRSMNELIESHTILYPKFARLQGKLSLLASQISNHTHSLSTSNKKDSTKSPLVFEDVSDDDIDGDQTQDELIPSPSEYDDYSGLSDDLDLETQDDNYSDINFEDNTQSTDDDNL